MKWTRENPTCLYCRSSAPRAILGNGVIARIRSSLKMMFICSNIGEVAFEIKHCPMCGRKL